MVPDLNFMRPASPVLSKSPENIVEPLEAVAIATEAFVGEGDHAGLTDVPARKAD